MSESIESIHNVLLGPQTPPEPLICVHRDKERELWTATISVPSIITDTHQTNQQDVVSSEKSSESVATALQAVDQILGHYASAEQAAISHDIDVLDYYGLDGAKFLNYPYIVSYTNHADTETESSSETLSEQPLKRQRIDETSQSTAFYKLISVTDRNGNTITFDRILPRDIDTEGKPTVDGDKPTQLKRPWKSFRSQSTGNNWPKDYIAPFVINNALPPAPDVNKRWSEVITTSYLPPLSFTYEISFHSQNSLGLNLRPHFIQYGNSKKYLGCCVVLEALAKLSTIVQPGDILLRLNDSLLVSTNDSFHFESITKTIANASSPRVIRFLRIAGATYNLLPSPAEILLLANDPGTSAKYNYVMIDNGMNGSQPNLQLTQIDSQITPYIKKLLMFTKVQWEVPYVAQTSYTKSSDTMQDLEGVFRDRGKWTVVVNSERGGIPHQFFVGRFDIEDEAIAAFNRANEDIRRFGHYSSKRVRRQISMGNRQVMQAQQQIPLPQQMQSSMQQSMSYAAVPMNHPNIRR